MIAGQDPLLERVFVCLLAGGHLLIEGVPGLAKTLTIKTAAARARRHVPAHPVHARPRPVRPRRHARLPARGTEFDTELGPVFCNFLLADEINRAPAKVQSALLEVMQERQVTLGKQTHPVPSPFLVMATQNPIESEGTYPLPEAQLDRFMLKVLVDYPAPADELDGDRPGARRAGACSSRRSRSTSCVELQRRGRARSTSTRRSCGTRCGSRWRRATSRASGSRSSRRTSSTASARAGRSTSSLAARALALLRGRRYVVPRGRARAREGRPPPPARAQLRGARRRRRPPTRARSACSRPCRCRTTSSSEEVVVVSASSSSARERHAGRPGPGPLRAGARSASSTSRSGGRVDGTARRRPPRARARRRHRARPGAAVRVGRRRAADRLERDRPHRRAARPRLRRRAGARDAGSCSTRRLR